MSRLPFIRRVEFSHTVLHQRTVPKELAGNPIAVTGFAKNVGKTVAGLHQKEDQVTGKRSEKKVCWC